MGVYRVSRASRVYILGLLGFLGFGVYRVYGLGLAIADPRRTRENQSVTPAKHLPKLREAPDQSHQSLPKLNSTPGPRWEIWVKRFTVGFRV